MLSSAGRLWTFARTAQRFSALAPAAGLVVAAVVSPDTAVRASAALVLATALAAVGSTLSFFSFLRSSSLRGAVAFAELPALFLFVRIVYPLLPDGLVAVYGSALKYAGPAVVLIEAVQIVVLIFYANAILEDQMRDREKFTQWLILGLSVVSFGLSAYWFYGVYTHDSMTVGPASFVSILLTLLIFLVGMSLAQDELMISHGAFLAAFVAFVLMMAVEAHTTAAVREAQQQPSSALGYLANLVFSRTNAAPPDRSVSFSSLLSLRFLAELTAVTAALVTVPLNLDFTSLRTKYDISSLASMMSPTTVWLLKMGFIITSTVFVSREVGYFDAGLWFYWRCAEAAASLAMFVLLYRDLARSYYY